MWLLYVIIGIVVIFLLWLAGGYNSLQTGKIKVEEAESGIDVALTKRFDVLTKMIEVVKGYAKHEQETLEKVISLRNQVHLNSASIQEKQQIVTQMDQAMRAINVVVEQYPDLKANDNFKHLQVTIADVEEHLQAARRVYNANVSSYNQKVQLFPSNIIANMFHFTTRQFFEAEEFKRKDVEMKF
ncbi:MAG: transrane protein LemA [Haloplasmataceae bacterium]|jgi:LemA protein|nr:transrane protein LemA [Haloplasmataceae bacterium]